MLLQKSWNLIDISKGHMTFLIFLKIGFQIFFNTPHKSLCIPISTLIAQLPSVSTGPSLFTLLRKIEPLLMVLSCTTRDSRGRDATANRRREYCPKFTVGIHGT